MNFACRFLVGLIYVSFLGAPTASRRAELKDETLKTRDEYLQTANSRVRDRLRYAYRGALQPLHRTFSYIASLNKERDQGAGIVLLPDVLFS